MGLKPLIELTRWRDGRLGHACLSIPKGSFSRIPLVTVKYSKTSLLLKPHAAATPTRLATTIRGSIDDGQILGDTQNFSMASHAHLQQMAEVLRVAPSKLAYLMDMHPMLLRMPSKQMIPRFLRLAEVLKISVEQVLVLVSRQPAVLTSPPSMFLEKAFDMEKRMGLPKGSVLPLLARQPEFFEVPTEKLASRCCQMATTLDVTQLEILGALVRLPSEPLFGMLGMRPSTVAVRFAQLRDLLQVKGCVPGTPLPDDPTIAEDGSIAFTPLLMRSPLPGAFPEGHKWHAARRNLRLAANAIERASSAAARLPSGPTCAALLVLKCPQLLLVPPEVLATSHRALLSMMQVPPTRLARWLARCPGLLMLPPANLQYTWACLQEHLGLPREALATRLLQQPQLLNIPGEEVPERLKSLSESLDWDEPSVRKMVRNQVQLLGASHTAVAAKIPALARLLELPQGDADSMARRQPALLSLSSATLTRNLNGLRSVLTLPSCVDQQPQLEADWPASLLDSCRDVASAPTAPGSGGSSVRRGLTSRSSSATEDTRSSEPLTAAEAPFPEIDVSEALPVSSWHPSVVEAAASQPTLLTLPPGTLSKKVEFIARLLATNPRKTCMLLRKHPLLLAIPSANLKYKIDELGFSLDLPQSSVLLLLLAHPSLVLTSPASVLRQQLLMAAQERGADAEREEPSAADMDCPGDKHTSRSSPSARLVSSRLDSRASVDVARLIARTLPHELAIIMQGGAGVRRHFT